MTAGTYVAVVITSDEDNMGRTWIDGEGMEEVDIVRMFWLIGLILAMAGIIFGVWI